MKNSNRAGVHIIADIYNVPENIICDFEFLKNLMIISVEKMEATILFVESYIFDNNGYTCIIGLAESHMSIHTWPEKNFISMDIFTCGDCDPMFGLEYFSETLKNVCSNVIFDVKKINRGLFLNE